MSCCCGDACADHRCLTERRAVDTVGEADALACECAARNPAAGCKVDDEDDYEVVIAADSTYMGLLEGPRQARLAHRPRAARRAWQLDEAVSGGRREPKGRVQANRRQKIGLSSVQ